MSVLIKGMDKETAMRLCSYAGVWMEEEDFIEIPPHGRLIDADELTKTVSEHVYPVVDYFNSRDYGMFWTGGIEKAINEQPTIIEAEE